MMFYISGSKIRLRGQEIIPKNRAVIFVSNHQGHMDSVIIQGFIRQPKGFVAIKEYGEFPIVGSWMTYMGSVFVDRNDIRKTFLNMNVSLDNLKRGQSMVVFPEGKLNDGTQTFAFERGWLRLATKTGAPIVPITIKGSHHILSYNGKTMRPSQVECTISSPIETDQLKKKDEQTFLNELREVIIKHL
jgi:1-acyl-sn-glycerol-3-phosphate acyltransferase